VIALEWHVGSLRTRGLLFDDMDHDDQRAVLTHYYKRKFAAPFDATTQEAATPWDLKRPNTRPEGNPDAAARAVETVRRLKEAQDARRGGSHGH
jgi:hypothetical protein